MSSSDVDESMPISFALIEITLRIVSTKKHRCSSRVGRSVALLSRDQTPQILGTVRMGVTEETRRRRRRGEGRPNRVTNTRRSVTLRPPTLLSSAQEYKSKEAEVELANGFEDDAEEEEEDGKRWQQSSSMTAVGQ